MGCFNLIGFHTHLPIVYGDEIILFLGVKWKYKDIETSESYINFSPGSNFTPIALPIFGTYDEYGTIENIVYDENVKIIEKYFDMDIDLIIGRIDDHMVGRIYEENEKEDYQLMCKKIHNNQKAINLGSDYEKEYELVFTIDHKFMYNSIQELGVSTFNFEKSIDSICELCLPWEDISEVYDLFSDNKIDFEFKYKNKEIDEYQYNLYKCRYSTFNNYDKWIDYLNKDKSRFKKGYLVNVHINRCTSEYSIFNDSDYLSSIREFNKDAILCTYSTNEDIKVLFSELKNDYLSFLKFISEMINHCWCFSYHVYGSQHAEYITSQKYYENIINFIQKKIKNGED